MQSDCKLTELCLMLELMRCFPSVMEAGLDVLLLGVVMVPFHMTEQQLQWSNTSRKQLFHGKSHKISVMLLWLFLN